ncbi:glycosyltransferase [Acinetobacter indicus]|uniref:glycosyltransferase n=1 Tax=Acinetobacter indicus TaxID=756892 RepID=UPI0013626B56|nr:glycosyltransferase [Acinetobacter indicus]
MNLEQSNPLVTVYIPTFNRVELLKRAVDSVRKQTYKNLEIIIVDDCSKDGTHEYLEEISKQDSRIQYFIKEKNSGACISRNIAIENAKGKFITGLDDDDYFMNNRIEEFVKNWDDKFKCIFSNLLLKKTENTFRSNYRLAMKDIVRGEDLLKANFIGNQIFTKSNYLKEIQGFDSKMQVWQDLECWYRVLGKDGLGKRVKKELYVVDMSHPHERISHNKGEKVLNTYLYFIEKHSLSIRQSEDLKTHMIPYKGIKLPYSTFIRKFMNYKTLGTFNLLIKNSLRVFWSK